MAQDLSARLALIGTIPGTCAILVLGSLLRYQLGLHLCLRFVDWAIDFFEMVQQAVKKYAKRPRYSSRASNSDAAAACLNADQPRWQVDEERRHQGSLELCLQHHPATLIRATNPQHFLCQTDVPCCRSQG